MKKKQGNIAIRVKDLKKQYRLGSYNGDTLLEDLRLWRQRRLKAENTESKHIEGKCLMALNGVDLSIDQGETVGIIGRNGAGKSTLLKLLCQITTPTEGEIELFGRITSMLEVGVGFNRELTGRENIYQSGAILGMKKKEIDAVFDRIVQFSEIGEFLDTPVKRYSSGMYVKLGFAVAAHLKSEIVIMDEVLAVGDYDFQKKCLKKMRELAREEKRTVLYVSHNMDTIRQLCDRVIVLEEGKVVFDGEAEKGIAAYMYSHSDAQQKHFDFSTVSSQRDTMEKLECKLLSVDLDETLGPVLETGDRIRFRMKVLANHAFDDLAVRFVISTPKDVLGSTICSSIGAFHEGEVKMFRVGLPTDVLMNGDYFVSIALTSTEDPLSNYDFVQEAFGFSIQNFEKYRWKSHGWGNVYLGEPVISEAKQQ